MHRRTQKRVWTPRPAGIDFKRRPRAPYWRGERAEDIVRKRLEQYEAERQAKANRRRSRRKKRSK